MNLGGVYRCARWIYIWRQWYYRVNGLALHPTPRVRLTRYILTGSPSSRSPNQRDANSVTLYSELKYETPAHCLLGATLPARARGLGLITFLGSHCLRGAGDEAYEESAWFGARLTV